MSIRIGSYDFFAHTIDGGAYLLIFLYWAHRYYAVPVDFINVSTAKAVIFIGLAFIIGIVFDAICSLSWFRLFRRQNLYEQALADVLKRNPKIQLQLEGFDWPIYFLYIKRLNIEMARDAEHYNVYCVMLRNVSFGLLIIAIQAIVEFVQRGYQWRYPIAAVICLLLSVNIARQAVKFQSWFYESILQAFIALIADPPKSAQKASIADRLS